MTREIKRADTHDERLAVAGVIHAGFKVKGPRLMQEASRLNRLVAQRATWWLLTEDGEPVSALLCYPLKFAHGEEQFPGFGLGAVATHPKAQRRGHGRALCEAVADASTEDGMRVGLLYSAIPAPYYEALGYRVAPHAGWRCDELSSLAASGPQAELTALDARRSLDPLVHWYCAGHSGLHIRRDAEDFVATLVAHPDDAFLSIEGKGYMRVCREDDSLEVLELFVSDESLVAPALRAAAQLTLEMGDGCMEGWTPRLEPLAEWMVDVGRAKTLPMVKGWDDLEGAQFWGTDYF